MSEAGPHHDDLLAMGSQAQLEIAAAERLQSAAAQSDANDALATVELGYYEAELRSLRGAAATLDSPHRALQPP